MADTTRGRNAPNPAGRTGFEFAQELSANAPARPTGATAGQTATGGLTAGTQGGGGLQQGTQTTQRFTGPGTGANNTANERARTTGSAKSNQPLR